MNTIRRWLNRFKLKLRGKNHIVGWNMNPEGVHAFFKEQGKTVLTFFGFSGAGYENDEKMLRIVWRVLSKYSPETTLVNIGATRAGIGATYPLAKSLGFTTTGIVSSKAIDHPEEISEAVDLICFVADKQWGGKLPDSEALSPTSKAMVTCSDILVGIGGNEIGRDEMLAGQKQGKPVSFYQAEVNHEWAIQNAAVAGSPKPETFWGAAHEVFGKKG